MASVRISSCGIVDVLTYDGHADVGYLQQDDLTMFGALIAMLCCGNAQAMDSLQKAGEHISRNYSVDLKSVALFLIAKPGPHAKASIRLSAALWSLNDSGRISASCST